MARTPTNMQAIARDAVGLGGLGAITYGAYQVYHPAGFIVGGLFAVAATFLLNLVDQRRSVES